MIVSQAVTVGDQLPRSARLRLNKAACGTRKPKKPHTEDRVPKVPIGAGAEAWAAEMASDMGFGDATMPVGIKTEAGPPTAASNNVLAAVPDAVAATRARTEMRGSRKAELRQQAAAGGKPAKAVRASGALQQARPRSMPR